MADCGRRRAATQTRHDRVQAIRLLDVVRSLEAAAEKQREARDRVRAVVLRDEIAHAMGCSEATAKDYRPLSDVEQSIDSLYPPAPADGPEAWRLAIRRATAHYRYYTGHDVPKPTDEQMDRLIKAAKAAFSRAAGIHVKTASGAVVAANNVLDGLLGLSDKRTRGQNRGGIVNTWARDYGVDSRLGRIWARSTSTRWSWRRAQRRSSSVVGGRRPRNSA